MSTIYEKLGIAKAFLFVAYHIGVQMICPNSDIIITDPRFTIMLMACRVFAALFHKGHILQKALSICLFSVVSLECSMLL